MALPLDWILMRSRLLQVAASLSLALLLLSACYLPPSPSAGTPAGPSPTASVPVSPSPSAVPSPSPLLPTLDPASVAATIAAGERRATARGVEPLCLRLEDTDDDQEPEWVGLYLRPGDPPRLLGFILDGDAWQTLEPPASEEERGLGEYATCELEVRDLNSDGRTEVAVRGYVETSTGLLHVFAWDGDRYGLLGAFEGRGGVRLDDADGDLVEDVVVRLRPEGELVREVIYTWDGAHYAWTWDRYAWYYRDRPHAYVDGDPLYALVSFYLALDDRDLPGAYGLLSPAAQAIWPYDDWALGYATTIGVEVGATRVVSQDQGRATVAAQVRALDNADGRVFATLYAAEWQLVQEGASWRLENGTVQELDRWEVLYYR